MDDYKNPRLIVETGQLKSGTISWQSPSNLAIIKYWGKYGNQLPKNPSISFTLKNAITETVLSYEPKKGVDTGIALKFFFEEQPMPAFEEKVKDVINNSNKREWKKKKEKKIPIVLRFMELIHVD